MITPRRRRATRAAAVLVAAALSGLVAGCTADGAGAADPTASVPAPPPPLDRGGAERLETALTSPDPAVRRSVLEPGVRDVADSLLPPGSTVVVDESRTVFGTGIAQGTAEVPATVSGPQPGRWVLLLLDDGGTWLVYGTRPA